MKTETPFLDFYKQCIKTGRLPKSLNEFGSNGLCQHLGKDEIFDLFNEHVGYWGYSGIPGMSSITKNNGSAYRTDAERDKIRNEFTSMRQTVILFCAAINNEL